MLYANLHSYTEHSQVSIKYFERNNVTITTLRDNILIYNYLSVVIKAFFVTTYCHLLPQNSENCVFSAKNINISVKNKVFFEKNTVFPAKNMVISAKNRKTLHHSRHST